jgi:hypothetical protein
VFVDQISAVSVAGKKDEVGRIRDEGDKYRVRES